MPLSYIENNMTRICHDHRLHINPRHREEEIESLDINITIKIKQSVPTEMLNAGLLSPDAHDTAHIYQKYNQEMPQSLTAEEPTAP